jgi:hypothetical protein
MVSIVTGGWPKRTVNGLFAVRDDHAFRDLDSLNRLFTWMRRQARVD